ncbi:nucleolar protein dao-5 isoform X2 [Bicyclus anynana]|nr:nucleolar protein dao-5 isoform X2 [Bicyclus anynana]
MLQRLGQPQPLPQPQPAHRHPYVQLTVQKAISLLDKLYDTFFTAPRKAHVNLFSKHFLKIEFLDKLCRPVYKEFDEWPQISLEPDPPKEKRDKKESPEVLLNAIPSNNNISQKMTRKSRPRIKEKEDKEPKGGYCEMCNADYVDAALHRRSPRHLAFVRDHTNFLALDSLITSGADVSTFLDKSTSVNGERRSLRKLCNGDVEPKSKRSKQSQSPDINGTSPRRNGLDEEKKHNTRCSKRTSESQASEDRQYYKVVGVSTKLRSSGGFAPKKKDSPLRNGTKPLVVKFRKVRRSELSVLSDEAEQFMFPKRASSASSTSDDDDEDDEEEKVVKNTRRKPTPQPPAPERQRSARPLALKEESSEEDSWPEDKRRRKRRGAGAGRRGKKPAPKAVAVQESSALPPSPVPPVVEALPEAEVSPLREEPVEKCMKWEDGRLKYTPAVEQLEFAFECVPHSEPWFETFKRQDQDKLVTKNVPQYFELYSRSAKLPYEIGQLPPLKPNCCPLSDLVKREEKPGPSRSYGTRGMKKQRIKKRTAALIALESHPRKSPREHASTLAILGSAGLLQRRKNADDAKSTASEDTMSDVPLSMKIEPVLSETQEASERLQQFLSEVFDEPTDYDVSEGFVGEETTVIAAKNLPDLSSLVSECEDCDIIRNEIKQSTANRGRSRRGKFKKNKTGWPNKKRHNKKDSLIVSSTELENADSLDRSSAEPPEDDTTQDTMSEATLSETEKDEDTLIEDTSQGDDETLKSSNETAEKTVPMDVDRDDSLTDDHPLQLDLKVVVHDNEKSPSKVESEKEENNTSLSSSDGEESEEKTNRKNRVLQGLLLQPIVRVARVDTSAGRRLRSAGRARPHRPS